ncbi:hypothetical protein [Micromonospora globbae]|uniref:Uncharacterized protein n=1 Tax=Micromonospora globbae TaxID=1894969 RepID=A0A420EQA6_9ACTN|nr:hypothetical protein [Micromonospora globbae]RKF22851.1 hypothetical protein D7I43_31085 [Micromonospora globbae]
MMASLIAVGGAIIAAVIGAWAVLYARRPRRADVEAVDAMSVDVGRRHDLDVVRRHDEDARALAAELLAAREQAAREQAAAHPAPHAQPARATSSSGEGPRVEPVDISVPERQSRWMDPPVVDLKLLNRGGESAVLTKMVVEVLWARRITAFGDLLPYVDTSGGVWLPPSATYDVELPVPEKAHGARVTVGISQVIGPGEADRFQVRVNTEIPPGSGYLHETPGATSLYLLRLHVVYNADSRQVPFRPLAVACPGNLLQVPTKAAIEKRIAEFRAKVAELRRAIDQEISARGMQPPDWIAKPPRSPRDLPADLATLRRGRGVNSNFWDPQGAIKRFLDDAEQICREISQLPPDLPDGLDRAVAMARTTLGQLPALRRATS